MKNNSITLQKEKRIARPLGVLIPLIRKDAADADQAAKNAALPYQVAAGEKLIEAKQQVKHGEWQSWLKKNFQFSYTAANTWMQMVRTQKQTRVSFSSVEDFKRKTRPGHKPSDAYQRPDWLPEMKERIDRVNVERLTKPVVDEEAEDKLERKLALEVIDIGYRALSSKLHPDKGGSKDAMSRLNTVRENLKACVNAW
jgi:hypothetical protein